MIFRNDFSWAWSLLVLSIIVALDDNKYVSFAYAFTSVPSYVQIQLHHRIAKEQHQHHHHHLTNLIHSKSASFQSPGFFNLKQKRSGALFTTVPQDADAASERNELTEKALAKIKRENDFLKRQINELLNENERLEKRIEKSTLVIETFEGENTLLKWFEDNDDDDVKNGDTLQKTRIQEEDDETDEYWRYAEEKLSQNPTNNKQQLADNEPPCEPGIFGIETCPVEPDVSFQDALRDRAYWLVGLLALQSCSGFILARNEILLQRHPVIVYFLTMLVGAGGNAGNQASVRVIRGLALGTLNELTQQQFLSREFKMAVSLSAVLSVAGFLRAIIFRTPFAETIAITTALSLIVFVSICLGAVLPLLLKRVGVDPAHSSTSIQVVMDILGVVLTVIVSTLVLDSPLGQVLVEKLSFS